MKYASVCSGIEAATAAWHGLGWTPVFFSEIEPFPCAVLAHYYPNVPNLGDMTRFQEWPDADFDVLVGGTPCQSFSVAGLRKGLDDPRGNLMLTFGAVAKRYRPRWLVWENVPGVLSSNGGRDFGTFLGMLAELGYGFAYRVLDAQYVRVESHPRAVPQRRRRVFVVGCLGDWRRAAAVLFERESLQGHPAPRREAGQGTAAGTAPSLTASGRGVERTGESRGQDPVIPVTCGALTARMEGMGAEGIDAGAFLPICADVAPTLCESGGHASPDDNMQSIGYLLPEVASCLQERDAKGADSDTKPGHLIPVQTGGDFDVAHALRADGFDASEDGTGRGTPLVPHVAGTLKSCGGKSGQPNGAEEADRLVPISFHNRQDPDVSGDVTHPLGAQDNGMGCAIPINTQIGLRGADTSKANRTRVSPELPASTLNAVGQMHCATAMQVRRLTPRECERLMGFQDDFTLIPLHNKKPSDALRFSADGTRYKALGNSMAVNVMRWIGERIQATSEI